MLRGSVTPRVVADVAIFGLIAFAVVLGQEVATHNWKMSLAVPVGPFEAIGAVLGLLLVLRTNAGYDRWWEARKLWGGIVNQCRSIATEAAAYGPDDVAWQRRFFRWTAALPYCVRDSLRGRSESEDVRRILGPEAEEVSAARHGPGVIFAQLSAMLRTALNDGLHANAFHTMEENRRRLIDHLGGCERIRTTPLARSSAIQVRRFILLFLITLPFALLRNFPYEQFANTVFGLRFSTSVFLVPLFVMLVSYPLLSLERIGMELQNPFDTRRLDHLPLDRICETIERNLIELAGVTCLDHGEEGSESDEGKKTRHPFASETYIS